MSCCTKAPAQSALIDFCEFIILPALASLSKHAIGFRATRATRGTFWQPGSVERIIFLARLHQLGSLSGGAQGSLWPVPPASKKFLFFRAEPSKKFPELPELPEAGGNRGIGGCEAPIGFGLVFIMVRLPGSNFPAQRFLVRDAAPMCSPTALHIRFLLAVAV